MTADVGKNEPDTVTVSKKEYELITQIRNLKEKGFTDDDILQLDRNKAITKENMQKARLDTIKINTRRIKHYKRSIANKQEQIDKKKPIEKEEAYIGEIKPFFMLQNELEEIAANIEQLEEINKLAQEEYDKTNKED